MKAAVFDTFGPPDVLHLADVEAPSAPGPGELLVRVLATSVNFGDTLVRNLAAVSPRAFHMPWLFWLMSRITFGWRHPRTHVLGSEFSGVVEAVGAKVSRFAAGDAVFGYRGPRMGAYAEYLTVRDDAIVALKPANLTFEEAAGCPYGALMAYGVARRLAVQPGERVLVVGASGGIGLYLVQLFRGAGATVTGVCGPDGVSFVTGLGAETVIDYTTRDFADGPAVYDTIVDVLGKSRASRCRRVLAPRGRLVYLSFKLPQLLAMLGSAVTRGPRVACLVVNERPADLRFIKTLVEGRALRCPVDRVFPLREAAAAHRHAEHGARLGAVVLTLR